MPDTKSDRREKSTSTGNTTAASTEEVTDEVPFVVTGDNLFAALGLPNAEERHAKMRLALRIGNILKAQKLTQVEAARMMGMAQSDVSSIVSGRTNGFTMERLFHAVSRLGYDIDIVVKPKPKGDELGEITVVFSE